MNSQVAGNFHVSPGRSFTQSHVHVHDINAMGNTKFNISHKINLLSFGDQYPGLTNPLDNLMVKIDELSHMYTYYIKIVPTTYVKLNGSKLYTNQFSVTKHIKPTALSGGQDGLPGVFFNYDLAPIMVWIKEEKKSFLQFLTNLCAIVGGVFTVSTIEMSPATQSSVWFIGKPPKDTILGARAMSSLIDSFIYHSSKVVRQKMEAGKLS